MPAKFKKNVNSQTDTVKLSKELKDLSTWTIYDELYEYEIEISKNTREMVQGMIVTSGVLAVFSKEYNSMSFTIFLFIILIGFNWLRVENTRNKRNNNTVRDIRKLFEITYDKYISVPVKNKNKLS